MNNFTRRVVIVFLAVFSFCSFRAIAQPTMTLPTVGSITSSGATLGGTIAGAGITARGTSWKTSSPVVAADNQLAEGGTTAGAYTHSRSGMPAGTKIYYVAYGSNAGGTAISSESFFYTLSTAPLANPATFTFSSATASSITLGFMAPNDLSVAASGYAIFRKAGSSYSGITSVNLPNGASPSNPNGGTYIGSTTAATDVSFTDNTASAGTQYTYALIPFGYDGSNAGTYNYFISSYLTVTAYSLSTAPTGQPASFTFTSATSSSITLGFTAPNNGSVAASGYAIFRKGGSSYSGITNVNLPNGAAPTNPNGGTYIGSTVAATDVSFTDNTASAATQYTYALVPFGYDGSNAGTYDYLITSYKTVTCYSLSTAPTGQPASFTFTSATASSITLGFTAPNNGSVAASGYAIFRKAGSSYSGITNVNLPNGAAPSSPNGGTYIGSTTAATDVSFTDNTVSAGTQYTYALVPFGYDGSNAGTYDYLITSYGTVTCYSLSAAPSGQPASFTFTSATSGSVTLGFSAPTSVSASGYAIFRKGGASYSGITNVNLPNGAVPTNPNGGTYIGSTAASSDVAFTDNTVSAATQYTYALVPFGYDGSNASTYNYLITSYKSVTCYSLSAAPSGQPASFTLSSVTTTTVNLAFSAPTSVSASGYAIFRKGGATYTGITNVNLPNGATPSNPSGGTYIGSTAASSDVSFADNTASAGTQYTYALIPFGYDGTNAATYNYLITSYKTVTASTHNTTSTITYVNNSAVGSPFQISYIDYQTAGGPLASDGSNSVRLGQFQLTDLGGDGVATTLNSVTVSLTHNSYISEIAIFDSNGNNLDQHTNPGSSVVFSGANISNISAANSNNDTFEIWATFGATVVDQQNIVVTVTAATVSSSGSGLATLGSPNTGASNNVIKVSSNQFKFTPSSLPNTAPNANFGPLTVTAVDALGNVQLSRSQSVTLSISSGSGSLTPTTPSQSLSSGTTTFASLSITAAGLKTIKAHYGVSGVSDGFININITSPGVKVTAGAVSTSPLCYSGDYQPIDTPIKLEEQDPGDFTSGGTFSIVLPTGFEFNTSLTGVAPTISGNEINTMSNYSYPALNTVQFSYNVSGTTNATLDKITISGLQIKYTGNSDVSNVTAVRLGGTAVQVGNATTDAKIYLTVSSLNSSTPVDFAVSTAPGQQSVNPGDKRFPVSMTTVQLIGNPSGGIFTGPSVSFNATLNNYVFSPSTVGVSTGNQIVYTYTEPTAPHCKISVTKLFDVYASVIQNLSTTYCTNANPSTGLTVLQADVDSQMGAGYTFYDVVYLDSYTVTNPPSTPGPLVFNGTLFISTTNSYTQYTYKYNWIGSTTVAQTVSYTYTYNSYYGFYGYTFTNNSNAGQNPSNTFDPSQGYYQDYFSGGVILYYRVLNGTTVSIGGGQYVSLLAKPVVTFSMAKTKFCDYDAAVSLVGSPTPANPLTDKFTGATGIGTAITSPSSNNWLFTPGNIGTKSTGIDITYTYTDPSTNCTNTSKQTVTVNPQPSALTIANVTPVVASAVNLNICQGTSPGSFNASPSTGPQYKWYADAALTQQAGLPGSSFTPPTVVGAPGYLDVNTVQSVQYYVTQSLLGCESPGFAITATINPKVTISEVGSPSAICQGGKFDLTTIGVSITGGATSGTWSNSGGGSFTDAGNNPSTAFSTAKFYAPSLSEETAGSASITITSATPAAPSVCSFTSKVYNIPISQAISVAPISSIAYCPGQNSAPIPISTVVSGGGVATATWSSALALGKFQDKAGLLTPANPLIVSTTSGANVDVVYIPFVSEVNSSTDIVLNDVKVTSNATGTCAAASQTTTVSLSASPTISVGIDQTVCADQVVNLTGSFGGKATKGTWTTTGSGNLGNSGPISTIPTNTTYNLSSTELNNSSDQVIKFTLTSDAPTAPCVAAQQSMNVTVHPIPLSPVVSPITYPNSQPAFCVNDPLSGYSVGATVGSVNGTPNELNWYSNAAASGLPLVTNNNLNLVSFVNTAISGTYTFWATQKTVYGCESKAQLLGNIADPVPFTVIVNPNPLMNFSVMGNGTLSGLCLGDQTNFDASTSSIAAGSIVSYQWDFADLSPKTAPSASPTISYTYKNIGTYNVSLTGISDKSCKTTVTASSLTSISPNLPNNSVLTVGPYPIADFSVLNQCLADNTQFTSIDSSSPKATISSYAWDFGDSNTSNSQNPVHLFSAPGFYNVSLTETSNLGCVNAIVKKTYILPTVSFTNANQFTYNESFENNNVVLNNNTPSNFGAWAPEAYIVNSKSSSTPSWNLLPPDGGVINVASNGTNAWVAGLLGTGKTYNTNETSVLNSPCFDISGLQKPVISFDYFADTWSRNDGVYMQYSVNNGITWNTLGKKGKGLNWYSNNFITGLSGSGNLGQSIGQEGWDGQSNGWTTARYSLSNVPGLAPQGGPQPIRFRIYFGSQGNTDQSVTTAYNGFGVDNVFIQNSNRTVLAENFTNSAATGATANVTNFLNFESAASQLSLVKIQYHTNIGGTDVFNLMNPVDPQARAGFYGVTSSFHGYIDGDDDEGVVALGHFNGILKPGTVGNPDNSENYYDSRTLVPAPLNITLNASVAGDSLIVNGAINVLPITIPANNHQYVIQMAVVEDVSGQFVVRKLIKDAAGKALTALAPNAIQNFSYSWKVPAFTDPNQHIDPSKLSAVCFVQDLITRDILQTNIVKIPTVSLVTAVESLMEEIQVYPNPADKEFMIQLPVKADKQLGVRFFNQLGQSVVSDSFNEGEQSKTISTQGLSDGMYILQIGDNSNAVRKKIMVVHK